MTFNLTRNLLNIVKFSTGKIVQRPTSPQQRMSLANIAGSLNQKDLTNQLWNNIIMGKNCTVVALKYSRCYLCKIPPIKSTIRSLYKMSLMDQQIAQVQSILINLIPQKLKVLRKTFPYFNYEEKKIRPAVGLMFTESLTEKQKLISQKFLSAVESVSAGFSLHNMIGTKPKIGFIPSMALTLLSKTIKDSYLVLGGDLFHIKGSVLASETGVCELSKLTAEIQIDLCKHVYLKGKIQEKIEKQGYSSVSLRQIHQLTKKKISPFVKSLKGMELIGKIDSMSTLGQHFSTLSQALREQIYQIASFLITYRQELEVFMFNFPQIVKKYKQYASDKIIFTNEDTLTYYLLYQGAKNQKRIDIAYLTTVQMISNEIQHMKKLLREKLRSEEAYQNIIKRINYTMMIYM